MLTCRELTLVDFDILKDLMLSRSRFLAVSEEGTAGHRQGSVASAFDMLYVGNSIGRIFGAFDSKGVLVGAAFTVVSSSHPCYYLNKAYTLANAEEQPLPQLFAYVISTYESLGYKRFYTLYRKQDIAIYHRLWRTSKVLANYVSYTDYESAPNERPKFKDYWELMYGRILYPVPMVVRGFVSKAANMFYNETQHEQEPST